MLTTKMIGNRIGEARKKINLSQSQLAEQLFISAQAVGKWERGESLPDIITLNRLAEILCVDLNYFSANPERAWDGSDENQYSSESSVKQIPAIPQNDPVKRPKWDMSQSNWVDADFSGLKNLHEKFSSSNMQRCKFNGSDLPGLLLRGNNVDNCDFSDSNITNAHIQRSNLANNKFVACSLNETNFSGSYISKCDFTNADFSDVTIKDGGFEKNSINGAVLKRTSFIGSYIGDTVFEGMLEDCYFERCDFKRVTFQNATLVNTFFKNNSLKRIKFVDCQADRLTYEFLKSGKADLSGITLIAE